MSTQHESEPSSIRRWDPIRPQATPAEVVSSLPSLHKGSIRNRVLLYLALNQQQQNTIRSIAEGIHTTHGRVSQILVELVAERSVRTIRSNLSQTIFILDKLGK